jgi:hypothetical protein
MIHFHEFDEFLKISEHRTTWLRVEVSKSGGDPATK